MYYTLIFILILLFHTKAEAIYTHDRVPNQRYIDAAEPLKAVVKIHVLDHKGDIKATGSGTYVQDATTGQRFILTASHVLRDGAAYNIVTDYDTFKVKRVKHFDDFVLAYYTKDYAITLVDARLKKRMYGVRFNDEADLHESLRGYGLDLAAAFVDDLPGIKPYTMAHSFNHNKTSTSAYWAVGYGETGSGSIFGGLSAFTAQSRLRKAFNPDIQDHYYLNFIHVMTGQKHVFTLLGSLFDEANTGDKLVGQVGPGDSGGPLLQQSITGKWQVCGIICSSLPRIHTNDFKNNTSWWSQLIQRLGVYTESRTPLSYVLSRESNVYGSESHYIDVTSPMVHRWVQSFF